MNDEEFTALEVVKDAGILGLALLAGINAGGLAVIVATHGPLYAATAFLAGLILAMLAVLISYLLAQAAAVNGGRTNLSPVVLLAMQLVPSLMAALMFVRGAVLALQTLN